MSDNGSVKCCANCKLEKELADYYRDSRSSDGLRSSCKECQLARNMAWNRKHPDKVRAAKKKHYDANADEMRAAARVKWQTHRAKPGNAERHRQRSRRWYYANRDKAIAILRRLPPLDPESCEYADVLRSDICCYCGGPMEDVDHIDPIRRDGQHHWTNLTAACGTCNNRKYSHPLLAFLARA